MEEGRCRFSVWGCYEQSLRGKWRFFLWLMFTSFTIDHIFSVHIHRLLVLPMNISIHWLAPGVHYMTYVGIRTLSFTFTLASSTSLLHSAHVSSSFVFYFYLLYVWMCVNVTCHSVHGEIRGQLMTFGSLLSSYGFWGMNSGHQL